MAQLSNLMHNVFGGMKSKFHSEHQPKSNLQNKEMALRDILVPHESKIMWIQTLLVWENPQHTAVLFVGVNLLFWLLLHLRLFYIIGIVGFCAMTYDLWFYYIWPEIKVPQAFSEDIEEWTHVHPRLLSVHDICSCLGNFIVFSQNLALGAIEMRRYNPVKFFVCSVSVFISVGVLGHCIPGAFLVYFLILCIFLVPMLHYHRYLDDIYQYLQSILKGLDNKHHTKKVHAKGASVPSLEESDSEDELNSLLPSVGDSDKRSMLSPDNDTESDSSRLSPDLNTKAFDDNSDDDTQIEGLPTEMPSLRSLDDTLSADPCFALSFHTSTECFTPTMGEMSDEDNVSGVWDAGRSSKQDLNDTGKEMEFVTQHFVEDSGCAEHFVENRRNLACGCTDRRDILEGNERLEEGLEFPDVETVEEPQVACTRHPQEVPQPSLNNTVMSLMQGAMAGLTQLEQAVKGKQLPPQQQELEEQEDFEVLSPNECR